MKSQKFHLENRVSLIIFIATVSSYREMNNFEHFCMVKTLKKLCAYSVFCDCTHMLHSEKDMFVHTELLF